MLSEALPAHTLSVPAPRSVIFQPTTVAVSVFFAAPDTGQMHIQFSFEICPMPKRQQKKSHDRRLVALATHHVFKLFNLKYDLFNFHYGYQQFADVYVISKTNCGVNIFINISIKHKRARFLRCLFIEVSLIYR